MAEVATQTDPPAAPPPEPPTAPTPETAVPIEPAPVVPAAPAAPANAQRWTKIIEELVLLVCHLLRDEKMMLGIFKGGVGVS